MSNDLHSGPWKLFGKLEYYQLMSVVFEVWAINLIASSLWLRRFTYGPVEWLWRSLTYAKMQPIRVDGQKDDSSSDPHSVKAWPPSQKRAPHGSRAVIPQIDCPTGP
jgi:hypothetical protein